MKKIAILCLFTLGCATIPAMEKHCGCKVTCTFNDGEIISQDGHSLTKEECALSGYKCVNTKLKCNK